MLKIYEWEWKQFPWQWHVEIKPGYRYRVTQELGKHWGLGYIDVVQNKRSGGHTWVRGSGSTIALPQPKGKCPLGLIIHELAHVYDARNNGGTGHRASFKKSVIKLQVEVRAYRLLLPVFAAIREEHALAAAVVAKTRAREAARAERANRAREAAASTEGRLKRVRERSKALRTRIKRLQTALKKAERQEKRLNRVMESGNGVKSPASYPISSSQPAL